MRSSSIPVLLKQPSRRHALKRTVRGGGEEEETQCIICCIIYYYLINISCWYDIDREREGDFNYTTMVPRRHRRRRFINLSLCGKHTHHTTVLYLCRIRRRRLACRSSAHHHSIIAVIWRIHARYSLWKWRISGFKQRRN